MRVVVKPPRAWPIAKMTSSGRVLLTLDTVFVEILLSVLELDDKSPRQS